MRKRPNPSNQRGGAHSSSAPVRWSDDLTGKPVIVRETARPAPTSAIDDDPKACVEVNATWARHIAGALDTLSVRDAWTGDAEHATQQIERLINAMYGVCDVPPSFKLRQSPVNPCHLEQSLDGGSTWLLAFDYSRCRTGGERRNVTIRTFIDDRDTIFNELTNISNTWEGDITNIYPTLIHGDSDDPYRDTALCYLVNRLVDAVCDFVISSVRAKQSNQLDVLWAVNLIGETLTDVSKAFTLRVASRLDVAGGALIAESWLLSQWVNNVSENTISPFDDVTARQEVACCWYNAMRGFTPTLSLFQNALNGCTGLTTNAMAIKDALQEFLVPVPVPTEPTTEHVYFVFADLYRQAIDLAKLGRISNADCPCLPALPNVQTFSWTYTNLSSPLIPPAGWSFFADRPLINGPATYRGYGEYAGSSTVSQYTQVSAILTFPAGFLASLRVGCFANSTPSTFRRVNVKIRRSGNVVYSTIVPAPTTDYGFILLAPNVNADAIEIQVEALQTYSGVGIYQIKVN